jgi:hypothetical protein
MRVTKYGFELRKEAKMFREPRRSHKETAQLLKISSNALAMYLIDMPEISKFYVQTMSNKLPYYKLSDIPKIAEHIKLRIHISKTRHLKVKK